MHTLTSYGQSAGEATVRKKTGWEFTWSSKIGLFMTWKWEEASFCSLGMIQLWQPYVIGTRCSSWRRGWEANMQFSMLSVIRFCFRLTSFCAPFRQSSFSSAFSSFLLNVSNWCENLLQTEFGDVICLLRNLLVHTSPSPCYPLVPFDLILHACSSLPHVRSVRREALIKWKKRDILTERSHTYTQRPADTEHIFLPLNTYSHTLADMMLLIITS